MKMRRFVTRVVCIYFLFQDNYSDTRHCVTARLTITEGPCSDPI
jgi:hypothetical protein